MSRACGFTFARARVANLQSVRLALIELGGETRICFRSSGIIDPRVDTHAIGANAVNSIAMGAGHAVTARDVTQFPWISTRVYNSVGTLRHSWVEEGFGLGDYGEAGAVAISNRGIVLIQLEAAPFYTADGKRWPFLVGVNLDLSE